MRQPAFFRVARILRDEKKFGRGTNFSWQNKEWKIKKPALLTVSLLPINQQLHSYNSWDESTIELRSKELFNRALSIWSKPKQE